MVTYDIGRLPVLENGQLVGIVTRTDVLRELHQQKARDRGSSAEFSNCPVPESVEQLLRSRISPELWQLLLIAANLAQNSGWQLYIVGGAVRDLLLATDDTLALTDIDLVVDGKCGSDDSGAGVELASSLQKLYPDSRLDVHGQFQTAALLWHKDSAFGSLWVDITTARTEFYPYPAANPEVEASSIRQDLYRRDFTINALAVRLGVPRSGELLDFFCGLLDLEAKQIQFCTPTVLSKIRREFIALCGLRCAWGLKLSRRRKDTSATLWPAGFITEFRGKTAQLRLWKLGSKAN